MCWYPLSLRFDKTIANSRKIVMDIEDEYRFPWTFRGVQEYIRLYSGKFYYSFTSLVENTINKVFKNSTITRGWKHTK